MALLKLLMLLFLSVIVGSEDSNPMVRIDNGWVKGIWATSTKGRQYASFEGIPYAEPPVQSHRFKAPRPKQPWTGVWDATESSSKCIQYDPFQNIITGEEDCLYLFVHSPNISYDAMLPVLIFIHGGAFMFGQGQLYDPSHFMDRDMIVVTMNYRLGPIGFASTGDDAIPGNAGLKDQALVLEWVSDNIERFGGDPKRITLSGHASGGACVHYHMLSYTTGTFNMAISYSGSALAPYASNMKPEPKVEHLAAIMDCPTYNSRQIAECLTDRPAGDVVEASRKMFTWKIHAFTPFMPTAEGPESSEPFISVNPYIASKHMRRVPLMISVVSQEGLYPGAWYQADPDTLPELNSRWDKVASVIYMYKNTLPADQYSRVAEQIKQYYLNGSDVEQDNFGQFVESLSDRIYNADVGKFAQVHASSTHKETYFYRYAYPGESSLSNALAHNNVNYGVSDLDDVWCMFNFPNCNLSNPEDFNMTQILVQMTYNFMTTGNPSVMEGLEWQQVKPRSSELPYLQINGPDDMVMMSSTDFGNKMFWSSLGFNENENYHAEN